MATFNGVVMLRKLVYPSLVALFLSKAVNAFQQQAGVESLPSVKHSQAPWALPMQNNGREGISGSMSDFNPTSTSESGVGSSRRDILEKAPRFLALVSAFGMSINAPQNAMAATKVTGANDGNLPDLPFEAGRSYLQYRFALQAAADYYVFEIQDKVANIDDWGEVNQIFVTSNNRGQGQPNKVERDFTNPMRIIGLSMPPDESEAMRDAQYKFERAMQIITKSVAGVRRDLPVEIDKSLVSKAMEGWDEGRVALNEFFTVLNAATGLNEMKLIPPAGPDQAKNYGRSRKRYKELAKKTKLCQNRGGPALSQAWGQLMVSGYLQENMDSCGIPDPAEYFYQ